MGGVCPLRTSASLPEGQKFFPLNSIIWLDTVVKLQASQGRSRHKITIDLICVIGDHDFYVVCFNNKPVFIKGCQEAAAFQWLQTEHLSSLRRIQELNFNMYPWKS